jgi:hypothetical protein
MPPSPAVRWRGSSGLSKEIKGVCQVKEVGIIRLIPLVAVMCVIGCISAIEGIAEVHGGSIVYSRRGGELQVVVIPLSSSGGLGWRRVDCSSASGEFSFKGYSTEGWVLHVEVRHSKIVINERVYSPTEGIVFIVRGGDPEPPIQLKVASSKGEPLSQLSAILSSPLVADALRRSASEVNSGRL